MYGVNILWIFSHSHFKQVNGTRQVVETICKQLKNKNKKRLESQPTVFFGIETILFQLLLSHKHYISDQNCLLYLPQSNLEMQQYQEHHFLLGQTLSFRSETKDLEVFRLTHSLLRFCIHKKDFRLILTIITLQYILPFTFLLYIKRPMLLTLKPQL